MSKIFKSGKGKHPWKGYIDRFLLTSSIFFFSSGSIDGNNQLVIKGRFQQKQIENVLRRYISELRISFFSPLAKSHDCRVSQCDVLLCNPQKSMWPATPAAPQRPFCRKTPGCISCSVRPVTPAALWPASRQASRLSRARGHSCVPRPISASFAL